MKKKPTVTFATTCWERDWRLILLDPDYLKTLQIAHHCYPFEETLLVINNVQNLEEVEKAAQKKVEEKVLSRYVVARDILPFFSLQRSMFNDWQYFNALGPLMAIFEASSDYLLYVTGDVFLEQQVSWIEKAIGYMEKNEKVKVANLTWNQNHKEVKKESYRRTWNFFVAKEGFSDQMFLVRTQDFKGPIYGEVREDASHFPRGDVWEKRVFSYLKNRGLERITYRHGSYTHDDGKFFERQS